MYLNFLLLLILSIFEETWRRSTQGKGTGIDEGTVRRELSDEDEEGCVVDEGSGNDVGKTRGREMHM